MKWPLTSFAVWIALLLLTILATDAVASFFVGDLILGTEARRPLSSTEYLTRFLLEAAVFSFVGILSALRVRSAPHAGLFALSLGIAYVIYVEWSSGLWYYLTGHPTRVDQFFFAAPVLAPVIFTTGTCLIWRALTRQSSDNAL